MRLPSSTTRCRRPLTTLCVVTAAALLSTTALLWPAQSQAQEAIFVPLELGASYEPQQLNAELVESARAYGKYGMFPLEQRDKLLDANFPELVLPDVSDLERKFAAGREAYFNGNLQGAREELSSALDTAGDRLVALTLRPGFSESTYQGGLYLIQTLYFGLGETDAAEKVIDELVHLFPTQVPDENEFPPELVETYKGYLPTSANGRTLTIKVKSGCYARINGKDLPAQDTTSVVVLPGNYGVSEVCQETPVRAFVVPVEDDTVVDFHDTFAEAFTYPINLGVDVESDPTTQAIVPILAEIGRRTGVDYVVGAGLSASDSDAYRVLVVDVASASLRREATVSPAQVSKPGGMEDLVNHLWTGEEFQVIEEVGPGGVDWTLVGGITMGIGGAIAIGGVVAGVLAKGANDDFFSCNADPECRARGEFRDHLKNRDRLSIVADVLYGTSAAFVTAGLVMIIVDQVGGGGESDAAATAGDWNLDLRPHQDGGMLDLRIVF